MAGRIVDGAGSAVELRGVNRAGTEYACVDDFGIFDGPSDAASIAAIKGWKVNAVRIPLNEDCWLGINGVDAAYSGPAYRQAIVSYVELLLTSGIYPIVDLHWTAPGTELATGQEPMPDSDHSVAFWTSVASTFKEDTDVVFELFNEPWPDNNQDTDAAWACWQSGGACPSVAYPVAGMQTLVTAVRGAGAPNLLLLGGVDYSNALSQWVAHVPDDPLHNLAAAWHVYPENLCITPACWDSTEGAVATSFPIVATEIGDSDCDGTFPSSVMGWLDMHGQSYLGWAWDTFGTSCADYSLITDYSGTPNGTYGAAFKTHLASVVP
jgi:endoglucanase